MQKPKGQKKPWLAALLNALIFPWFFAYPGYLYVEKRWRFFLAFAVSVAPMAVHQFLLGGAVETFLDFFPLLFAWVLCPLIFAIDAWRCAKDYNARLEREKTTRELTARRFGINVEDEKEH